MNKFSILALFAVILFCSFSVEGFYIQRQAFFKDTLCNTTAIATKYSYSEFFCTPSQCTDKVETACLDDWPTLNNASNSIIFKEYNGGCMPGGINSITTFPVDTCVPKKEVFGRYHSMKTNACKTLSFYLTDDCSGSGTTFQIDTSANACVESTMKFECQADPKPSTPKTSTSIRNNSANGMSSAMLIVTFILATLAAILF